MPRSQFTFGARPSYFTPKFWTILHILLLRWLICNRQFCVKWKWENCQMGDSFAARIFRVLRNSTVCSSCSNHTDAQVRTAIDVELHFTRLKTLPRRSHSVNPIEFCRRTNVRFPTHQSLLHCTVSARSLYTTLGRCIYILLHTALRTFPMAFVWLMAFGRLIYSLLGKPPPPLRRCTRIPKMCCSLR